MSRETKHIGCKVLHFECVASTNEVAREMATDRANDGVVVLADEQTAGRGQRDRKWVCPRGAGVLMSVLLFPPEKLGRAPILTAWAAVSVCETIFEVAGLLAKIKWPNDVLIDGRKVCGILIEQGSGVSGQGSEHVVAGIGLNVTQSPESFAEAQLPEAGSLAVFGRRVLEPRMVAEVLIEKLDEEYGRLLDGDIGALEERWKRYLGLLGRRVLVECLTETWSGRLNDVTFDAVEVETEDGKVQRISPETVRHMRLP